MFFHFGEFKKFKEFKEFKTIVSSYSMNIKKLLVKLFLLFPYY